jgi:hypothetical protein
MHTLRRTRLSFALLGGALGTPALGQTLITTDCPTNLVRNIFITQTAASTTTSTAFVLIPGATTSFVVGNFACIKVLFTAETACRNAVATSTTADYCVIRATINGAEMNPAAGGSQVIDSESDTPQGHAFEWIDTVGEGNNIIRIERRVLNSATRFQVDDWTLEVQRYD